MSEKPVSVAMVGISSYGQYYLNSLLDEFSSADVEIRAVISRSAEKSDRYPELMARNVKKFHSLEEFYGAGESANLAVISSPIHYHLAQTCEALKHGSHVLCEKPLGATVQEADLMIKSRDAAGRWVMIGYQWSYSRAIQSLKKDLMEGMLGKPVRAKTLCFWPRDELYYSRNNWAGRKKDGEGNWVLDSPANNAMAHFLHNLLYLLGSRVDTSAQPAEVVAELYRAYPIENYDSVASRIITGDRTEILFYASHTIPEDLGPMFALEYERGTVTYGEQVKDIVAKGPQGEEKHYGSPDDDHQFKKLFEAVAAVREPRPIICGPEASRSQTLCINGIQELAPDIVTFPEPMIHRDREKGRLWVRGLAEAFFECYQRGILPSEAGYPWARCGRAIDLKDYAYFPGGRPASAHGGQ